ncbi:Y-family DNA polymerase [Chitinophaga sancti]|uniref:DNA polymerase Y family protein n=1 Tax=Chitinophaga sancti TaxID=1004 RepID=A0A1K1MUS8_9BACT|nr:DNA polymerase Y family protein [Chitinophaga sancti]WQD63014.1 DNA polymerase Y family protein [Chitinophaga sancti]WQG91361.1 DNA polymerase Y family protein [Chitinophaga sancti]SFW26948.1 protein ImuB [Chitinophaga sancti]
MAKRYIAIWFRHLLTDWYIRKHPDCGNLPLVFSINQRGKQVITATSKKTEDAGIYMGMAVADAKAIFPELQVTAYTPDQEHTLLNALGQWCIRYSPVVAIDQPDGLLIDASGCAHLWGGEQNYLTEIILKLKAYGYDVRGAMADTIGTAWAVSRYSSDTIIVAGGFERKALRPLPPASLRLEEALLAKLQQLGFHKIEDFIHLPLNALKRRFGQVFILRLKQALGAEREDIIPIGVPPVYEERLSSQDPIKTAKAIIIALTNLLDVICHKLQQEGKGIRTATLLCYRIDDQVVQITIGTNGASNNAAHLLKLFELKIPTLAPGPGIDLFILQASLVEDVIAAQEKIWSATGSADNNITKLLDRIESKIGVGSVKRYQVVEHYWPEMSVQVIGVKEEQKMMNAGDNKEQVNLLQDKNLLLNLSTPRPEKLLPTPLPIEVTAPIPDYPPMNFRFLGRLHEIKKADGPERIEREWWLDDGEHRDYYIVEDAAGRRYWIFRLGHYAVNQSQWFIHGFFA